MSRPTPRLSPGPVRRSFALLGFTVAVAAAAAQTPPPPADRLPPAGISIPDAARTELAAGAAALRRDLDALAPGLAAASAALLPDAEIYHKAVDWALRYDEFFDAKQVAIARHLLEVGRARVAELRQGRASWLDATGLVVRGYRSKLDQSVQPYALVIPADWKRDSGPARRLDVVLPGRGEKRTELAFIDEHEKRPGEIVPAGAVILHPYGRYCNATKFAGEVDVFEALQAVRDFYPIDPARIVVRGFSMGGASTWHLAVHHPDVWAAASPGAGFAETARYAKVFAPGKSVRPAWEQALWRWYDATGWAANLRGVPTVAYSGELDPQKQAADVMSAALEAEGLKLEHLIGPKTEHKYHPEVRATLAARLDALATAGRPAWPAEDRFTTYTPRYARSARIIVRELEQMWERADVQVRFPDAGRLEATTHNVTAFSATWPEGTTVTATIDGQVLPGRQSGQPWFVKENGRWAALDAGKVAARAAEGPRKGTGLSGPVMDAFMDPFLFVRPTGRPLHPALGTWVDSELRLAVKMWRDLFRGDVLIKDDSEVTEADLAQRNVVLWGDPSSNRLIARLLATRRVPLDWNANTLTLRGTAYDAKHHAPILIFPNPLTTAPRYVVLNSGVDFRHEAYGTNSLQTPKLPDYAVVDLRESPGPRWPGKITTAGFFDARWK